VVLVENGFKVDSFNDASQALENFTSSLYDLVILDVKMPKMSGFSLYNEIRKIDSTAASESSNGNNSNSNATHDTSSNSVTHLTHHGAGRNQYKDNSNNSDGVTNIIINKSKQKLKVGDIPFP
jgi:DNA-binding NarL/FixJ family response regulator